MLPLRAWPTVAIAMALAVATVGTASASDPAGRVMDATGTWLVNGKPLAVGDAIAGATTIVAAPANSRSDFIRVKLYGGLQANDPSSIVSCFVSETCARGLTIPAVSVDAPFQQLQDVVFHIFLRERPTGKGAVRGVAAEQLSDGVVALSSAGLALGSTATAIDNGTYDLILTSADAPVAQGPVKAPIVSTLVIDDKHPAASASVAAGGLAPGLYHAHLEHPNDPAEPLGDDALFLVVTDARYAAVSGEYARMAASARPVDASDPASEDARAFLRATLEALEHPM